MNELVSFFHNSRGLESLTPEQTVTCLSCFMHDEETWTTARRAGISIPEAEQCLMDFWNVFSYRKQVNARAGG
ncbi:MAG: hypothetical protein IKF60_08490 [Solobacterium sp.]|nr:hypothetical protein [Solobacterium sp.]MBR3346542.1 hypothetical protein [Solobacterium sp.]